MLKNAATGLAFIIVIVASDYIGQNGWSAWLGIPLIAIYAATVYAVIRSYYRWNK